MEKEEQGRDSSPRCTIGRYRAASPLSAPVLSRPRVFLGLQHAHLPQLHPAHRRGGHAPVQYVDRRRIVFGKHDRALRRVGPCRAGAGKSGETLAVALLRMHPCRHRGYRRRRHMVCRPSAFRIARDRLDAMRRRLRLPMGELGGRARTRASLAHGPVCPGVVLAHHHHLSRRRLPRGPHSLSAPCAHGSPANSLGSLPEALPYREQPAVGPPRAPPNRVSALPGGSHHPRAAHHRRPRFLLPVRLYVGDRRAQRELREHGP